MRLDREYRRLFETVLRDIKSVCPTDRHVAERLSNDRNTKIPPLALAKLKRGDSVGDDRWRHIVDGLVALVGTEDANLSRALDSSGKALLIDRLDRIASFGTDCRRPPDRRTVSDELDLAARRYAALREDPESQVPWGGKVVIFRTDNIDTGHAFEDKLDEALSALLTSSKVIIKDRRRVQANPSGYRKMLDWNIATLMPVFLLFPFFLTQNRRQNWGVIPYGQSRSVRLVLRRRHFEDLGRSVNPTAVTMDEFNSLLERDEPKPLIHGVGGYSAQQIIIDAIRANSSRDARADRVYSVQHLMMVPGWPTIGDALREFLEQLVKSSDSLPILAFNHNVDDPGHRSLEDQLTEAIKRFPTLDMARDLSVCTLIHESDVPVGIGYSLPAFDWVAQNGNYDEIRRQAIAAANVDTTHGFFKEEGVELDQRYPENGAVTE